MMKGIVPYRDTTKYRFFTVIEHIYFSHSIVFSYSAG